MITSEEWIQSLVILKDPHSIAIGPVLNVMQFSVTSLSFLIRDPSIAIVYCYETRQRIRWIKGASVSSPIPIQYYTRNSANGISYYNNDPKQ